MAIAGSLVVTVSARTQEFEAGMKKTTATLKLTEQQAASVTQAFNSLGASMNGMSQKAQTAANSTTSLNRSMKETGGVMADLKTQLTGLVAGFIAFSALKAGVMAVVDAALKQERLVSILTAVTGSQEKATQAMAFARQEAERFGVEMNAATEGYGRLLGATKNTTLEGARTNEMYQNILATMSAFKVSAQDQNDIMRATTQILQQQAIQGDELKNEIGSRLPITQRLVEASNGAFKTQLEFNKAMADGKIKGEAASAIMYNLFQIMARDATKAGQAGKGAAAEFSRFNNALQTLKETIGVELLPVLAEAARALAGFIKLGGQGAGAFGGQFLDVIRQMTSALIGLAGGAILAGKYIAALSTMAFGDTEAWRAGWDDVQQFASQLVDLQTKLISGGFAAKPGATAAEPGAGTALPVVLGGGKEDAKAAKKTAAERESERIGERQKDIINEIANAYDAANAAIETGVELERTRMEQKLREAKFTQADFDTLMATYDATQKLLEQRKADEKLAQDRLQLSTQLQESLDKQLFTERELLSRKLTSLGFSKEEAALKLKMFDTEVRLREEAEKRKEAEQDALQATKEHFATLKRLQDELQPRVRQTRAEELQGTISEMAGETTDPFALAQADLQRQETLRAEWLDGIQQDLEKMGEALASTFVDMAVTGEFNFKRLADSFSRMTLEMVADAIDLKGAISGWLKAAMGQPGTGGQAGTGAVGWLSGLFGSSGGAAGAGGLGSAEAITSSSFGGGGGAFGAEGMSFAFAGGMAAGGPVFPRRMYTVGERGPETFIPGQPGRIVPNGGGSVNVIMNINTPDVGGFRASEKQLWAAASKQAARARRNI